MEDDSRLADVTPIALKQTYCFVPRNASDSNLRERLVCGVTDQNSRQRRRDRRAAKAFTVSPNEIVQRSHSYLRDLPSVLRKVLLFLTGAAA